MTVRAGGHVLTASGWEPEAVVGEPATKKKATPKAKADDKPSTPPVAAKKTTETETGHPAPAASVARPAKKKEA